MNQPPGAGEGWRGPPGHQQNHSDGSNQPQVSRPFGNYQSNMQPQGLPHQQGPAPVLPPPSFQHQAPSGGHSLPALSDLTHGATSGIHQPSPYNTHPPPPSAGHSLAGFGQAMAHQPPQHFMNREREMHEIREREIREREMQRHQEEAMLREREAREREMRDREHMERIQREQQQAQQQHPVQSHTGSIPIHQPVANKVGNSIHGPNGLLSSINSGPGPVQQSQTPASTGGSIFGMSSQAAEGPQRQASLFNQQPVQPPQPAPVFAQAPQGPGPSPMPAGQQPILNDALSYLDQVKVRFNEHPDVYNRFLDIMKDFKSQAIDTPGVIERVSNLFNGHPSLIQGFNTFLPPGYRIECGTDENPDAIRVTTPSGTMTQSLNPRGRAQFESLSHPLGQPPMGRQDTFEGRPGWSQTSNQISPGSRQTYGQQHQGLSAENSYDQDVTNAAFVHQQEQRGVSQLQNAVSAATNGNVGRPTSMMQISPNSGQSAQLAQSAGQAGLPGQQDMKRGPVEFNHAISYVNKIKNRFAQQPEIYKQFLEILQTYQRESKPIQDVYAQVTQLFNTAPDLLEDFKQFLPESAAQAKAQAAARAMADEVALSNVRGDPAYGSGQNAQAQTPRPAAKMPPMGQFDPPSTSKENKKRRGGPGTMSSQVPAASIEGGSGNRMGAVQVGNAKRAKLNHTRPVQPEAIPVSPTLVPSLPQPLPPNTSSSTQEELGFFDRAKKHIGNKSTYTEFLKLINLFSQDIIDKHVLVDRVGQFVGNSVDLMNYFVKFLGVDPHEEVIEARIRPDPGRVNLAHCRSLGPSYRFLPRRDQDKMCKGRDEMCYQVLNDVWASHPTWASEDSGFVAHRKNQYEEGLHRLEEERHDYDFNIESCQRTIQLMEPIVQQINLMNEADRANFVVAPGLGGQSEAIPKRVIMKIYGRESGQNVLEDMEKMPALVLPVVLRRLKQKLEEWKQSQREWEKVWRDQTSKFFWKSLDHQGINAKNLDKKNFVPKTLTSEIQAKYLEGKKTRDAGFAQPKYQFEYEFDDKDIILDAAHLTLVAVEFDRQITSGDKERFGAFVKDFVPAFFGLDRERFVEYMSDIQDGEPGSGDAEDGVPSDEASGSKVRLFKPTKTDFLRRGLLDRRNGKEGSVYSDSKASTPAPAMSEHGGEDEAVSDAPASKPDSDRPWTLLQGADNNTRKMAFDEMYPRTTFNLYCNANIYCFFRLFETLYSRLLSIKKNEALVHEAVNNASAEKAAINLRMVDKMPQDFFRLVSANANYYRQILEMCEEVVGGLLELNHLEETLRRFYIQNGWQLYTADKLLAAITKFIQSILGGEAKDKSTDVVNLFFKDREKGESSHEQELQYRNQVKKLVKEGEVYRISYDVEKHRVLTQILPTSESTFDNEGMNETEEWQYYVTSYGMSDPTEGVPPHHMQLPILPRNMRKGMKAVGGENEVLDKFEYVDEQVLQVDDKYHIHYQQGKRMVLMKVHQAAHKLELNTENDKFRGEFVKKKGKSEGEVQRMETAWRKALAGGFDGYEESLKKPIEQTSEDMAMEEAGAAV